MVTAFEDRLGIDRLNHIGSCFDVYRRRVLLDRSKNPEGYVFPRDMEFATFLNGIGFMSENKMDTRYRWCSFNVERVGSVEHIFIFYPSKQKASYKGIISRFENDYRDKGNFIDIGTVFFIGVHNHLIVVEVTHRGFSVRGSLDLNDFLLVAKHPKNLAIDEGYIKLLSIGLIDIATAIDEEKVRSAKEKLQNLTPSKIVYSPTRCISPAVHNVVLRELYHVQSPNNHYKRLVQDRVDIQLYVGQVVYNSIMHLSHQGYIPQDWSQAKANALRKYIADMVFDKLA